MHRFYVTLVEKQNEGLEKDRLYKTLLIFGTVNFLANTYENIRKDTSENDELKAILAEDEFENDFDAPEFESFDELPEDF